MQIQLNGKQRDLPAGSSVADLIADLPHRGVAVAVDGVVVPRSEHDRVLTEGVVVEVVTAVQGG
ncbi:sulfur carrier protein ThiS [Auraticoccus monumenti]|uniref:Sulfur carrier protein n=1 Tax=Auraticoccus monumenti TaxID=675864 RepID=A0A1G7DQW3_9ACTN|nr:sulfur carrier protein ThiS [Auraticoccus monumenti]SDE53901.1 sulfur carrier protein [Auraticoccus monumenti]